MTDGFKLHPDLVRDGIGVGSFRLCRVLMIDDQTYPWFVLVPQLAGVSDTIDLPPANHARMWEESRAFGRAIMDAFAGDKLNVAALGNMTPQLHLHHVVRYRADPAWPGPIWGKVPAKAYSDRASAGRIASLQRHLLEKSPGGFVPASPLDG